MAAELCGQPTARGGAPCRRRRAPGADRCAVHLRASSGWRSLLTPEIGDHLVQLLRAGNYLGTAAHAAGVAPRTLRDWMQRGVSELAADEPYRELRKRLERALGEGEAVRVAEIARASSDDWRAAAWMLERQYPERWGRPSTKLREDEQASDVPADLTADDPFAEVDELAAARRRRAGID